MTLSEELQWRGFVNQTTFKEISELDAEARTFYWGVDPSSDSMTIGNLAAGMMARVFMTHGYKAVLLVGGATGLIGDPDGKDDERELKSLDEVAHNKAGLARQYDQIFSGMEFQTVDNFDWFKDMNYLTFLRVVGKHVPMRTMLGREFVQSRLGEDGAGISYAEFSYSLIQGYDFLHMYKEMGVTLQLCGADQWGNSIAGVDLIRRIAGGEAHIWSTPLIINKATGKKFGKSEEGAIWLDADKTSVFKFYQFWLNVDDEGVMDYMKVYTTLPKEEVDRIAAEFEVDRAGRVAQKTLAYEVTKLVHGEERANSVARISEVLFGGGDYHQLTEADFDQLSRELPIAEAHINETPLHEVMVATGLASSNGEARRFLQDNAVYINGQQFSSDQNTFIDADNLGGYAIIRRGKNTSALVQFK